MGRSEIYLKTGWKQIMRFTGISLICFFVAPANSQDLFSCKIVSQATLKSDSAWGRSLYGDSEFDRRFMALQESEILKYSAQKITFAGSDFNLIGKSGMSEFFMNSYWGLLEIYDRRSNEATLYVSRSNGYNSQKSNFIDVELWHCHQ